MDFKSVDFITTDEAEGKVEAVFSVFNEIDSDGDVVLPDSIKSGYGDNGVAMVWGHDWKDVVGRGEIIQDDTRAVFKGQFIMDTARGRDAFNTVKAMAELQQWSFGYEVADAEIGMFKKDGIEEQEVRFLKELKVWEVSPVLVGANQNTETVLVKSDGMRFEEEVSDVRIRLDNLIKRSKELTSIRLEKEKPLSDNVIKNLVELQDTITGAFAEITDMLAVGSDESEEVLNEMSDLWAETNTVLAETADPDL